MTDVTDKQKSLLRFLERNPHPPWMNDRRYFDNDGFGGDVAQEESEGGGA